MIYAGAILTVIVVISAPIIFSSLHKKPTCFDGKQNQGETAIDKGGPCINLDGRSLQEYSVLWARAFPIRDGFYNAVAYVENPNARAGMYSIRYEFKLYDDKNILIAQRFGSTPLFPGGVFPVFESRIDAGNRVPARTTFSFVTQGVWKKMKNATRGIEIYNQRTSDVTSAPRVDAVIKNNNLTSLSNIILVAVLFDDKDNAIATSRTLIENLNPGEDKTIAFTWPRPFKQKVARIDIIPLLSDNSLGN